MTSPLATPSATPARRRVSQVAVAVLALVGVGIVVIGARFLLQPGAAAAGYGVPTAPDDPFLAVKGVRDIGSGLVILTVLALASSRVLAGVALAFAVIPLGDMAVVLAGGGPAATAFAVHGATAVVMIAAASALLAGHRGQRKASTFSVAH